LLGICTLGRQQATQATTAASTGSGHSTLGQGRLLGSHASLLLGNGGFLFGDLLALHCVSFCGLSGCGLVAATGKK
jgi:hypothetical protein